MTWGDTLSFSEPGVTSCEVGIWGNFVRNYWVMCVQEELSMSRLLRKFFPCWKQYRRALIRQLREEEVLKEALLVYSGDTLHGRLSPASSKVPTINQCPHPSF